MNTKKLVVVLVMLMVLTLISAFAANSAFIAFKYIITIAFWLKFLLVGFYFMDVFKAHTTWKLLLVGFSLVFFGWVAMFMV